MAASMPGSSARAAANSTSGSTDNPYSTDPARRVGLVGPQRGEGRIAPVGETDEFAGAGFRFRRPGRLQNLETAAVDKEGVIAEQIVQLGDRRMIVGKNLGRELAQGLFHL